ncbi:SLAC1 family transporter [Pacificibacter marinus]|uniref:Potassium-tellurite ethidium and proflavin transporter n=1 Tax=Pacificibacter marinus TaxID=658057 RepID=A0A1Y5SV81_9RHOB|nr:tellurium resistance protein [Pacificibacter marinus]SEK83905.1 tellurite resistance protein [Pacificibacter marinus]SLN48818.1 potassium-tellurite ethidium and proflavin transporter [Pacificibacter marinus]
MTLPNTPPNQRLAPKPFNAAPKGLWRATPLAIFPPILGLFGIGLAWRAAAVHFGAPDWIGEMILGAVSLLYIFCAIAYKAKVIRRPSALLDDAKILPGRAGLSAATASMFLFAATLVPYWSLGAKIVLIAGLFAHAVGALVIIRALILGPSEQRRVTPVWHLSFVGFIIAPVAAVPLGWHDLSALIYATTLPIAVAIWLISALQFMRAGVPAPLRPLLAIHMAPVSLFGIVSVLLGYDTIGFAFGWLGLTGLLMFLASVRYLTQSGFSPMWGAFTFPMAAFANLMFMVAMIMPMPFRIIGGIELVLATLAVVYIAYKVMQLWTKGTLSKLTNASTV